MKNIIKYLALATASLGALNANAGYTITTGQGDSLPSYVAAGSPVPTSGKSTFVVTFGGGAGTWTSAKLGGFSAADPTSSTYDAWYSAVGNRVAGTYPVNDKRNVSGYNGSYFQLFSDNNVFTDLHIDASSTLLLNAGTKAAAPNDTLSPNGTYQTAGGQNYVAGAGPTSYTLVVDWTLAANQDLNNTPIGIYFKFAATNPSGVSQNSENTALIDIVAVPEPGQALAGAMLLGCGALVFTGRRWISKSKQATK